MSLAMAPERSFIKFLMTLQKKFGMQCGKGHPLWVCECSQQQYEKMPPIVFKV
jgi:hypothetical protein